MELNKQIETNHVNKYDKFQGQHRLPIHSSKRTHPLNTPY